MSYCVWKALNMAHLNSQSLRNVILVFRLGVIMPRSRMLCHDVKEKTPVANACSTQERKLVIASTAEERKRKRG